MNAKSTKEKPLTFERFFLASDIWNQLQDDCLWQDIAQSISIFFIKLIMFQLPRQYNSPHLAEKIPVAILWATGMVGRRFAELLAEHPYFQVVEVAASENSRGKNYGELVASRWNAIPENLAWLTLGDIHNLSREKVRMVFSAFEGSKEVILATESELADRGFMVVSNNSAHRWTENVPMMLPEVNPEHLALLRNQLSYQKNRWGIIVKPNCSVQSFVPVLHAWRDFWIRKVHVVTEQSISGAGKTFAEWPEMVDNVIPHIGWEEEKTEKEPLKILGSIRWNVLETLDLPIHAICTRVATSDGHMANVFVEFDSEPSIEELETALNGFGNPLASYQLPTLQEDFIVYNPDQNRPQTRLDRDNGNGMSITVGRLQKKGSVYSFSGLSHNTIRWAAWWAVLSAELLYASNYL